jgi:hypothetical protein
VFIWYIWYIPRKIWQPWRRGLLQRNSFLFIFGRAIKGPPLDFGINDNCRLLWKIFSEKRHVSVADPYDYELYLHCCKFIQRCTFLQCCKFVQRCQVLLRCNFYNAVIFTEFYKFTALTKFTGLYKFYSVAKIYSVVKIYSAVKLTALWKFKAQLKNRPIRSPWQPASQVYEIFDAQKIILKNIFWGDQFIYFSLKTRQTVHIKSKCTKAVPCFP